MLKKKFNDQLKVKNQFMEKCKLLEKEKKNLIEKLKKKEKSVTDLKKNSEIPPIQTKKSNSLSKIDSEDYFKIDLSKSETILSQKNSKNQKSKRESKLLIENDNLKKMNLLFEKDINHQKKINEVHLEQIKSFITEIRSQSEINLEMKKNYKKIKEEKEIFEKEKNKIDLILKQKIDTIKDFEIQIKNCMKNEADLKEKLNKMENQIVKPKKIAYIYRCFLEGLFKEENVILILRENFNREIILEIENFSNERFFVKFENILKIEKEKGNKNRIRFFQKNLFNGSFVLNFKEDNQFYEDLKKYWEIFLSDKGKEDSKENRKGFFSSIKNIIFN